MSRYDSLRASDADRDAVTERLREAAGEGRLTPDELEERVDGALRARTYGELARLVGDLPAPRRRPGGRTRAVARSALPAAGFLAAVTVALAVVVVVVVLVLAAAGLWLALVVFWLLCCGSRRRLGPGSQWRRVAQPRHRPRPSGLL